MNEDQSGDIPFSVSDLAGLLKRTVEGQFGQVRVQGELSRVTKASSGHMYFDVKDENAVLHAAWFKGAQRKVPEMAQGLEVIVTGRLTIYPARSEYQMVVTAVEPAGIGALLKLIEDRKKKLAAEGLFEASRKRKLPYLPRVIGLITSPTGAVLHDMLHRFEDRCLPHILLWPVMVQGEGAAEQVRAAVEGFNHLPAHIPTPDVLIVARGGGSVEDLMPFNDEALVRAVAASSIPVISAVGHETDWTLIDLAADLRAPTPTGAAEFAVPVKAELEATVADLAHRLRSAPLRGLREMRARLVELRSPRAMLENLSQKLDDRSLRLGRGLSSWLERRRLQLGTLTPRLTKQNALRQLQPATQRLLRAGEKLEVLSYQRTLDRGFALITTTTGQPVTSSKATPTEMIVRLADGSIEVRKV